MQGQSHVGFALVGSIVLNNALYAVSTHSGGPTPLEIALYSAGAPFSYPHILHALQTHQVLDVSTLANKVTYLLVAVYCARWPDQIEKRSGDLIEGHRGFTHSILILFLMLAGFLTTDWMLGNYLHLQFHFYLSPFFQHEVGAVFLGVFSAFLWHIVADMFTTMGVKIWWPGGSYIGWLPRHWRFNNGSWGEYFVLWGFIAIVGYFIGHGILGL